MSRDEDVAWWRNKIDLLGRKCFNTDSAKWAGVLFDVMLRERGEKVEAQNLPMLAAEVGIPQKYLARAIATVNRSGLTTVFVHGPVVLMLHKDRLKRRKNSPRVARRRRSRAEREYLARAHDGRCAHCGSRLVANDLELDHIVPLSLLGADELANLVPLCTRDNRMKLDKFDRMALRSYRGEVVKRPVQLRFVGGAFWPVINGQLRRRETISSAV